MSKVQLASIPLPKNLSETFRAKTIKPSKDLREALHAFGLDWETGIRKVCMSDKKRTPIPGVYATYRTDTNEPLGIVRGRYQAASNYDSMRWVEELLQDESLPDGQGIEFGAALAGGKKAIVGIRLGHRTVGDENLILYLVMVNSNDGQSHFVLEFFILREKTMSVLNLPNTGFKIRHTGGFDKKLKKVKEDTARPLLDGDNEAYGDFNAMMECKISKTGRDAIIRGSLGITGKEFKEWFEQKITKQPLWVNHYHQIYELLGAGPGADTVDKESVWAMYCTLIHYIDHVKPVRGTDENRADIAVESKILGTNAGAKLRVLAVCKHMLTQTEV